MILTLTGPSGIGKGFVTTALVETFSAKPVRWTTTRTSRHDKSDDTSREFVDRQTFEALVAEGRMTGVQEWHGEMYGLRKDLLLTDDRLICEINSANVESMFPLIPSKFSILLYSYDNELLRQRIRKRAHETSHHEVESRLRAIAFEMDLINKLWDHFDCHIEVTSRNENTVTAQAVEAAQKGSRYGTDHQSW